MDCDHFIITVYCLVCEHYQAILQNTSLRQARFAPALTDEEVITIEIVVSISNAPPTKTSLTIFKRTIQIGFRT